MCACSFVQERFTVHPAEGAFEHRLLHLHGYEAGHQASQSIIDNWWQSHLQRNIFRMSLCEDV